MINIEELEDKLIGLSEQEGIDYINKNNISYRVIRRDEIYYIITCDFRVDRINLEINNNIILGVTIG